jgi:hypothetical protein
MAEPQGARLSGQSGNPFLIERIAATQICARNDAAFQAVALHHSQKS